MTATNTHRSHRPKPLFIIDPGYFQTLFWETQVPIPLLLTDDVRERIDRKLGDEATIEIALVFIEKQFMTKGGQGAALWKRGPSRLKTDAASRMTKPASPAGQADDQRRKRAIGRLARSLKNQAAVEDERVFRQPGPPMLLRRPNRDSRSFDPRIADIDTGRRLDFSPIARCSLVIPRQVVGIPARARPWNLFRGPTKRVERAESSSELRYVTREEYGIE